MCYDLSMKKGDARNLPREVQQHNRNLVTVFQEVGKRIREQGFSSTRQASIPSPKIVKAWLEKTEEEAQTLQEIKTN